MSKSLDIVRGRPVVLVDRPQRSSPFGRPGRLVFPAFREYSEKLHEEIRQAKKNRDWAKVEQLREEGQTYGIRCEGDWINVAIGVLCALVLIAVLLEI